MAGHIPARQWRRCAVAGKLCSWAVRYVASLAEDVCLAVQTFFAVHQRLPRRQNSVTSELSLEENNLARRWHRLLRGQDDGFLAAMVLEKFPELSDCSDTDCSEDG